MDIQRLSAPDWKRFRRIRMEALSESPNAYGSTFEDAQAMSEVEWRDQLQTLATFVAVFEGTDVGIVRGAPHDTDPASGFLLSMWVAARLRGRGVGERLIRTVVAWARSEGYSKLVLDVADDNLPAIGVYARMGFEPTGETGSLPAPRAHIREHRRATTI